MTGPSGYNTFDYGRMVDCEPRMGVYAEALRRSVTPGCTVIDLGASFGAFALLACQYGAGRVIAIEPDPSIELLMPLAQANGCADKITVVRDISTRYVPETKADVIVSDCRGAIPLFEHHINTIKDARERLLAPGGTLMPMRDTLKIALISSPATYRPYHKPWQSNDYGLDLKEGTRFAVNTINKVYLKPSALLTRSEVLGVLDYRTVTATNLDATVDLIAERAAIAHGFIVWFDAEIAEGLGYSNAPGQPRLVYGQTLLPLAKPLKLAVGGRVEVRIRLPLIDGRYLWNWDWRAHAPDGSPIGAPVQQSSFLAQIHSPKALAKLSNLQVPVLEPRMMLDRDCLALVGDGRTLDDIAKTLQERYPELLPNYEAALDQAAKCLSRYSDA